ncbi:uncharacterized protein BXZ73DRAFT_73329 [Epithele typhae]|uniref:uncharacterized protein n=1 Tax=Epithele typhae TaxID=378194 RepID=UPI002008D3EE|nr:uncharacterized protein BXZ73DRAFT_73329 [Epithele typhae]KAH9945131.1 hypothetical protein BXZ73DRAFT_73329 [Epithele typhae]
MSTSRPSRYQYPPAVHAATNQYLGMSLANQPLLVISRPFPQQPMPALPRSARYPQQEPRQRAHIPAARERRYSQTHHTQQRSRTQEQDPRKRHGVIFTGDPLRAMLADDDVDDEESTWSMSRSRLSARMHPSRRRPPNARNRNGSPAQEIAARYRASRSGDEWGTGRGESSTSAHSVSYVDGWTRPRTMSGLSDVSGPRLRHRDSRVHAMDRAKKEAFLMAIQAGGYYNVPCRRAGCRQILATISDLASHLVLHDIDPRATDSSHPWTPVADARASFPADSGYSSFIDMGHSVSGPRFRRRRRYSRSPAPNPYERPLPTLPGRRRSKLRHYLAKLTLPCTVAEGYDEDDFFY